MTTLMKIIEDGSPKKKPHYGFCPWCGFSNLIRKSGKGEMTDRIGCLDCNRWINKPMALR